jgi:ACS family glucarate transporter-like MFS transporter
MTTLSRLPAELQPQDVSATRVRYAVLAVTTVVSLLLYLDRICIAEILKSKSFEKEFGLTEYYKDLIQGAFFFSYALCQVPAGWLSDRFGARGMMTFYVVLWSLATACTGIAAGVWMLIAMRLVFGMAQAGAYPTSGGLLSRWIPFQLRASASSIVALGGRAGGAFAPWVTVAILNAVDNWRLVLGLYGLVGLGVATVFWCIFRERPEAHPRANAAECELIRSSRPANMPESTGKAGSIPIIDMLVSPSMFLMGVGQFTTNVGWAFLVMKLPDYLDKVQKVSDLDRGPILMFVILVGLSGLLFGGWLTDLTTRKLGVRWGRAVPMAGSKFLALLGFVICLCTDSLPILTAGFALVAFATDLGIASTWAFAQDVGGRHVGSILGYGNMWGNLGAAVHPLLVTWAVTTWDPSSDNWHAVFIVCGAAFLVSGLASLGINATIPIVKADKPTSLTDS